MTKDQIEILVAHYILGANSKSVLEEDATFANVGQSQVESQMREFSRVLDLWYSDNFQDQLAMVHGLIKRIRNTLKPYDSHLKHIGCKSVDLMDVNSLLSVAVLFDKILEGNNA